MYDLENLIFSKLMFNYTLIVLNLCVAALSIYVSVFFIKASKG